MTSIQFLITIGGEATRIFAILVLLLSAGLGPILLVRECVRFPLLAAPFAGMLLINFATLGIYFAFVTTFATAVLAASAIVIAASVLMLVTQRFRADPRQVSASLLLIAVASIGACVSSQSATLRNGSLSSTFLDGWDALAYAQVADWIMDHRSRPAVHAPPDTQLLHADPAIPYESVPQLLFGNEPRTGAFGYLAALASARAVSGAFAYDWACAVLLASAILGVGAIFAGTWPALAVLVLGLAVSHWYDYTQSGFLAKSLAYPSVLFLAGLILKSRGRNEPHVLALLCAFSAASAALLSGLLTAVALVFLCVPTELIAYRAERRVDWPEVSRIAICVFVAVATSGYFQHPVTGWDRRTFAAASVSSRSLDLEGWFATTGFSDLTLILMIVAAVACAAVLGRAALLSDQPGPAGLLLGPIAVYALLLVLHLRPELMETTGLLYPAMMCGSAWLISKPMPSSRTAPLWLIAAAMVATIGLRIPRALTAITRYVGDDAVQASYSKPDLDALAAAIGKRTALIAIGNTGGRDCMLMLVELGRRGLTLQWTEESWYWAVRSWRRDWEVPHYASKPQVIVIRADHVDAAKPLYLGRYFAVIDADDASPSPD